MQLLATFAGLIYLLLVTKSSADASRDDLDEICARMLLQSRCDARCNITEYLHGFGRCIWHNRRKDGGDFSQHYFNIPEHAVGSTKMIFHKLDEMILMNEPMGDSATEEERDPLSLALDGFINVEYLGDDLFKVLILDLD